MNPLESDPLHLEAYIKTYLKDEIHPEGLTRNLSAFARLLEAKSFSQGPMLNISSVGREGHVERKVVENYFFEIKRTACWFKIIFSRLSDGQGLLPLYGNPKTL